MHIPVLKKEILEILNPQPKENFIDCTLGGGGHTFAILEKIGIRGKLLAIDRDEEAIFKIKQEKRKFGNNLILACDNFANLKEIVEKNNFPKADGILLDLGLSSEQLQEGKRGFSFQKDEKLDMRFNPKVQKISAQEIINEWPEQEIEKILKEYGEERFSLKIARNIAKHTRPVKSTLQLVEIIKASTPGWYHHQKIHFATKTFQALRMAVNDELNNLKKVLPQALDVLNKKGRLAVISFHSLEDRIIKNFLRENYHNKKILLINKKPIMAGASEVKTNPRSRSAKLRGAIKTYE